MIEVIPPGPPIELRRPTLPLARPLGPGGLESVAWTISAIAVHLAASVALAMVLIANHLVFSGPGSIQSVIDGLFANPANLVALIGGEQAVFVAFALAAVWLRLGSPLGRKLGVSRLAVVHVIPIALLVVPLALLCGSLYSIVQVGWTGLVELWPALQPLDRLLSTEAVEQLAGSATLPQLILILAAFPAIGEELLFRGLIGRGLVARLGVTGGVLLTSVLFGLVHLHPAHAIAVIPLGIAMHALHLLTKSIWAPMLLHFANNAWASVVVKLREATPLGALARDEATLPAHLQLVSVALVAALFVWLWQTRSQDVRADGSLWSPGFATVEAPPGGLEFQRIRRPPGVGAILAVLVSLAAFGWSMSVAIQ